MEIRYQSYFSLTANSRSSCVSSQKYEQKIVLQPQVAELPSRGLWDIHLAQKYPFENSPRQFGELYVDLENVLDDYYEEDPGKAAPGRTIWVGIRGTF